jgi:SAM-dependent methyltransferase
MLTYVQYQFLRTFYPGGPGDGDGSYRSAESKLRLLLGAQLLSRIPGRTVIDFGCGRGHESVEMALAGARRVIRIDIREDVLASARINAEAAGVSGICKFTTSTREPADVIVSIDAFEHFHDPAEVLSVMDSLLRPGGEVLVSFGPPWCHPRGGHLFSPFPWAHLLLSEDALIRWRSEFKSDGATRFSEVAGGLNRMTIKKFEELVAKSPFQLATLETIPIQKLRAVHNRLTREFTTSIVRCRLVK